jgi:CBS domain-containing protein
MMSVTAPRAFCHSLRPESSTKMSVKESPRLTFSNYRALGRRQISVADEGGIMKVKDVMTRRAVCCSPETNVGAAVELLWGYDCGMLPIVGPDGKLAGIVTDRDICIAMGTRNCLPGDLTVGEIATAKVFTCRPEDEIHEALATMAERRVRRLPVVNDQGFPQGVLSVDDIVSHGDLNKWQGCCELSSEEIIRSLKKLYQHERTAASAQLAAAA